MATLNKVEESIIIQGKTLYKPSKWLKVLKYVIMVLTAIDFIYLLVTRYKGPITFLWAALMLIGGFLSYVMTVNVMYNNQLISTDITVHKNNNQEIEFIYAPTEFTKETKKEVRNIRDIIAITAFFYVKLMDSDGNEIFEVGLDNEDSLKKLTHYIIENTGAYLVSM